MRHNATGAQSPSDSCAEYRQLRPHPRATYAEKETATRCGVSRKRTSSTSTALHTAVFGTPARSLDNRVGRPALSWRTSPGGRLSMGRAMSDTSRSSNNAPVEPGPFPWWSKDLLRGMLAEGKSKTQIAEEWGCSRDTITRWISKHGLTHEEGAA